MNVTCNPYDACVIPRTDKYVGYKGLDGIPQENMDDFVTKSPQEALREVNQQAVIDGTTPMTPELAQQGRSEVEPGQCSFAEICWKARSNFLKQNGCSRKEAMTPIERYQQADAEQAKTERAVQNSARSAQENKTSGASWIQPDLGANELHLGDRPHPL